MLDLRLCFTCRWGVATTPAAFFLPQIRNRLRICHTLLCAACTHGILFPQIGQRWPICPALRVLPARCPHALAFFRPAALISVTLAGSWAGSGSPVVAPRLRRRAGTLM